MGSHRRERRGAHRILVGIAGVAAFAAVTIVVVRAVRPAPVASGASPVASPAATVSAASPSPSATVSPVAAVVPKPKIVWSPIPFPASRKREMAAYSREHYGTGSWRLVHPRVIVEHFTTGGTFASAWSTFARDVPDQEFHSLPADCAHFIVDTDGTIHQLVPLGVMCRHTVGLNWTSVGIEMVGTSDAQILANPRELRSAIRLTAWLMGRLHIQLRNVIGHNESLDSRFHRERLASWRCQTHQDWQHRDMVTLRGDVARYLRRFGIPSGPPWRAHPQAGC
jgi:N-acetylmuramoyl-L-alanine amidase